MATHIGFREGVLYPQPDYTLSVDREGKWTATQVYLCHARSVAALMPRPGSKHPDLPFLGVDTATAKVVEGELAEITCTYAGVNAGAQTAENNPASLGFTYSLDLSLSEEPLLAHYRYRNLSDTELEALKGIIGGKDKDDSGNTYKDRITSTLGKSALRKIQRGEVSYYSPKVVWKASIVRDYGIGGSDLNHIGHIDTPIGPAPALASGRNWLLNGVTEAVEGLSYRIEWQWLSSDRGGWDPDHYAA